MRVRPFLLLLLIVAAVPAAEDVRRERLRAELKEASEELARLSRAVNLIHELVAPSVVSVPVATSKRVAPVSRQALTS